MWRPARAASLVLRRWRPEQLTPSREARPAAHLKGGPQVVNSGEPASSAIFQSSQQKGLTMNVLFKTVAASSSVLLVLILCSGCPSDAKEVGWDVGADTSLDAHADPSSGDTAGEEPGTTEDAVSHDAGTECHGEPDFVCCGDNGFGDVVEWPPKCWGGDTGWGCPPNSVGRERHGSCGSEDAG